MNIIKKTCKLPDGREITIETGKLARQADGAVVVTMGKTMLLATVVASQTAKEGVDFLPMSVDYQEKFASTGKIPGGFLKREGRLSDYEILISRLVDRAIRPLFPDDYHAETQVSISLISGDENSLPDSLAAFAASSAFAVSDIPIQEPISEVRVVRVGTEFIVNPTLEQKEKSDIDLIVAASKDNILMVEGEMKEPGALAGSHWVPVHPHDPGEGASVCFHIGGTIMGLSGNDIVGILVETRHSGIIPEHRDNPALSFLKF